MKIVCLRIATTMFALLVFRNERVSPGECRKSRKITIIYHNCVQVYLYVNTNNNSLNFVFYEAKFYWGQPKMTFKLAFHGQPRIFSIQFVILAIFIENLTVASVNIIQSLLRQKYFFYIKFKIKTLNFDIYGPHFCKVITLSMPRDREVHADFSNRILLITRVNILQKCSARERFCISN